MPKEIRPLHSEPWMFYQYSTLFRRGLNTKSPNAEFLHIADAVQEVIKNKEKIRLLIIGVAWGEEPLSILSVLDTEARSKGKKLEDSVELHTADIKPQVQSREIVDTVYKNSLSAFGARQVYIENGLTGTSNPTVYRIRSHIRAFLEKTFANPKLSRWETPVQTVAATDDGMRYDCIVYNNVHGHIPNSQEKERIIPGLVAKLSPGGILITDGEYYNTVENNRQFETIKLKYNLKKLFPGIYQRG